MINLHESLKRAMDRIEESAKDLVTVPSAMETATLSSILLLCATALSERLDEQNKQLKRIADRLWEPRPDTGPK
jgi:hypothetical protein